MRHDGVTTEEVPTVNPDRAADPARRHVGSTPLPDPTAQVAHHHEVPLDARAVLRDLERAAHATNA